MTIIVKEDGIMSEVIECDSIEIIDGELIVDLRLGGPRIIKITDRFCMEVE